jgi:phage-related protein (TIGR01555 family)
MRKQSIKGAVRDAIREDKLARKPTGSAATLGATTTDSFVNFAHKLGIGADNALSSSTYGYNPITRNRILLEWIHRGSWLGGVAVDLVADDMTRAGIEFKCEMPPEESGDLDRLAVSLGIWEAINETIKWGRLYGGSIGVMLIDGQDMKTPLRVETVGRGQFKGLLSLDRWMVEPSLEDLCQDFGPHLGLPNYYKVTAASPALKGVTIHHSRLAFRMVGVQLPYQQRLTENLWGISVLERLYDRMVAFDSASTGAAQLVYKSYLRTLKVEGLREIVAAGGAPLNGLMQYTEIMRRYQGIEGLTMIDSNDDLDIQGHQAFSGLSDALNQFGQQLSGALQIPLVRLFGQSPAGLNSSGESDLRTFYDHIRQQQRRHLLGGITTTYKLIAQSEGVTLPDDFAVDFRSLWDLDDVQKADVASKVGDTVSKAVDGGLIGRQTALKELRQSARLTGIFTNITQELINSADDEVMAPGMEDQPLPGDDPNGEAPTPGEKASDPTEAGVKNDEVRPNRKAGTVDNGPSRRVRLQH